MTSITINHDGQEIEAKQVSIIQVQALQKFNRAVVLQEDDGRIVIRSTISGNCMWASKPGAGVYDRVRVNAKGYLPMHRNHIETI